ncbi:MAG: heme oxygenase [Pedobacter sp.]|nr:MAG: heme oxygenase [Pedobacter sp.]
MLSEEVKEQTKVAHQELEKKMIAMLRSMQSEKDYINILKIFYSYFGGLEQLINEHINGMVPDMDSRRKAGSLAADLGAFNGEVPPLAHKEDLPVIDSPLQALGALYVIEGSTLGGKIISKMVSKQLGMPDNKGLSFFNGYEDASEDMWVKFKAMLNSSAKNLEEEAIVIAAANDTFSKFSSRMDAVLNS